MLIQEKQLESSEFSLPQKHKVYRRNSIGWIASHTTRHWYLLIGMVVGAISNAVLATLVPIYIGQAFNAVLASPPQIALLLPIAVMIAITQVLRAVLQFGRNFSAELIGQRLERDIREELYVNLLGKSMTFHSLQPVGDTMARATNDVREINFMFNPGINLVVGSAIFMFTPLVASYRYHPSLILVPVLFIIGYFLALWQYLHELNPITTNARKAFGNMNTRLSEALDGIETVKGMAQETEEVRLFGINARKYRDFVIKQGDVEARFIPVLLLVFAEAAGLLHAILLYQQGILDVGQVVGYFSMIQLFGFPTFTSLFAYSQVSSGMASARRILELINRENNLDQNRSGISQKVSGTIEFHDVSFEYESGHKILENVSFCVEAGQTVAVVGQTGSGKTSLGKLINRTYDVTAGAVLIDGVDVRAWNLETLRKNISIIEQDIFLYSRTITENIAFGIPEADQKAIIQAAKAAQVDEFVHNLKDGYDTVVGERGVTLSGGQRQRLALARAFLTNPSILILDDSTSAIDSATEDRIQRAIYTAAKGRTTIMITHRLSQIRWADLIIVLKNGKLVASGKHEDLLNSSEAYRRIFTE
jgi:ATP-binding cassette, subfamily B, bacterial